MLWSHVRPPCAPCSSGDHPLEATDSTHKWRPHVPVTLSTEISRPRLAGSGIVPFMSFPVTRRDSGSARSATRPWQARPRTRATAYIQAFRQPPFSNRHNGGAAVSSRINVSVCIHSRACSQDATSPRGTAVPCRSDMSCWLYTSAGPFGMLLNGRDRGTQARRTLESKHGRRFSVGGLDMKRC